MSSGQAINTNQNRGKFYNQETTTTYFTDIENSIMDFYNMSMKHFSVQDEIVGAAGYQGESAEATKGLLSAFENPLLMDILLLQTDLLQLQSDIQNKFKLEVDSADDANLEYDVINQIETDFKGLYEEYNTNCQGVERLAERCQKYNKYYNFSGVDFTSGRTAFENFCGGDNNEGYLSEVKSKLVKFDAEVTAMIIERGLDKRINALQSLVMCSTNSVELPQYMSGPQNQQVLLCTTNSQSKNKSGLNYDGLMMQYGLSEDDIDYLKENYPVLLMQIEIVRRYSTSDADKIYDNIERKLNIHNYTVYGEVMVGNDAMSKDQINSNAEYVYWYLSDKGWTKEAICGLLGNMYEESKINPGIWQNGVNSSTGGYGLVQFTAADKKEYYKYMENKGYSVPDGLNELVRNDPKTALNCQLDYLSQSRSWLYSGNYAIYFDFTGSAYADEMPDNPQMSFKDFQHSNASPASLALIFHAAYERSGDTISKKDERGESANDWYEYFRDYE